MQFPQCRVRRVIHDHILQLLQVVAKGLDHRVVGVDDRVHDRVTQIARTAAANRTALARADAATDRLQHIAIALLEREHVVFTHHQRDLLHIDVTAVLHFYHPRNDQHLAVVHLGLRTLGHIDHVFHRQGVDRKDLADLTNHRLVAESLDVDPCQVFLVQRGDKLLGIADLLLLDLLLIETEHPNPGRRRIFGDHQRAGPGAHLGMPLLEERGPDIDQLRHQLMGLTNGGRPGGLQIRSAWTADELAAQGASPHRNFPAQRRIRIHDLLTPIPDTPARFARHAV